MGWMSGRTVRNTYACEPLTATCIVLRRLASPCRYRDIEQVFGMHTSKLSEVFWEVSICAYEKLYPLIRTFRDTLMQERTFMYAGSIQEAGGVLDTCVGFMDGTKIHIARPVVMSTLQRACYSGHKRYHFLVYQTITTPDGLVFHMYGPIEGRQPDAYLYHASNIDRELSTHLHIDVHQYNLYADKAYYYVGGCKQRTRTHRPQKHMQVTTVR